VSKGFVLFAQNTESVDYVTQAYALALSIQYSQKEIKNVSLVTNSPVPKKYRKIFDQIIPIPWFEDTDDSPLKGEHRWKLYHASPYDETIILDSDMLLLEDITQWWEYCHQYDVKFCSKIKNYKLDYIKADVFHRKAFIANNLSNPYFALHYFKKGVVAHDFYKVLEFVCNNWQWCYSKFAPLKYQDWLSMDLAAAIAIEISGLDNAVDLCSPLDFIHMKSPLQGWAIHAYSWQDTVSYVLNTKGELIVGNIKQTKLFHYVEKNFITKRTLTRLEELARGS
jgi:hypothetical protein